MQNRITRLVLSLLLILCLCFPGALTFAREPSAAPPDALYSTFNFGESDGCLPSKGSDSHDMSLIVPMESVFQAAADAMRLNSAAPAFVAQVAQSLLTTANVLEVPISQDAENMAALLTTAADFAAGEMRDTPIGSVDFVNPQLGEANIPILAAMLSPALQAARARANRLYAFAAGEIGDTPIGSADKNAAPPSNQSGWNIGNSSPAGNQTETGVADSNTPSLEVNASGGTDGNCGISAENGLTTGNQIEIGVADSSTPPLKDLPLPVNVKALDDLYDAIMRKAISEGLLEGATVRSSVGGGTNCIDGVCS